ncbi:MAG TPA: hypothetical protein VFN97_01455 [Actinospica sp.]|nr:hypothetical protein [Actinospica sp.]
MTSGGPSRRLRHRFVEAPGSLGDRARGKRWDALNAAFPDLAEMRVIDLGGRADMWQRAPVRPAHVHLVNLEKQPQDLPDWITAEVRDLIAEGAEGRYDLAFSNSVIEHVGGFAHREAFAGAVRELAPRHWVQTPYRYFPVEPHFLFPGFQFLPLAARAEILRRWPLVHSRPDTRQRALETALSVELLSRAELQLLFPDSEVIEERVAGIPKSLIAVARG